MRALLRRKRVATEPIDIRQMLDDVVRLLRPDAVARHIALRLDVADGLPRVQGDRVQLQQVLLNLIQNGMDAIGSVDPGKHAVMVTAGAMAPDLVEISVADTGSGIPAELQHRLFDPFFTTKAAGIGLGLSISRGIVEAHGGRLWSERASGGGAAFYFTLRRAPDAHAALRATAPTRHPRSRHRIPAGPSQHPNHGQNGHHAEGSEPRSLPVLAHAAPAFPPCNTPQNAEQL